MTFDLELYLMKKGYKPADARGKKARLAEEQKKRFLTSNSRPRPKTTVDGRVLPIPSKPPVQKPTFKSAAKNVATAEEIELLKLKLLALRKEKAELITKRLRLQNTNSALIVSQKAQNRTIAVPAEFFCQLCRERVLLSAKPTHRVACAGRKSMEEYGIEESFEILPSGPNELRIAFERDTKNSLLGNRAYDYFGTTYLHSLKPSDHRRGSKGWKGYAAFVFSQAQVVILESPLIGNATYVLRGDWRAQARLTKREVRDDVTSGAIRIFHRVHWRTNVHAVLNL